MSEHPHPTLWTGSRLLLLLLLMTSAAACGVFESEEDIAKNARVVISGTTPVPLTLITSTQFERSVNEDGQPLLTLIRSDTTELTLSSIHDQIYPIRPDKGFLARVINPTQETATISMQVYFDGELKYDQQNVSLTDSSIEFSFIFESYNIYN